MLVIDVPALSLLAEEVGVEMLADADFRRRARLTRTSEQSARGPDDVRVWFTVPLVDGTVYTDWYFDIPIPAYNQIAWARERPEDAVATVALSRALLSDIRERRLDIEDRRLDLLDLGVLAWLLLRLNEEGGAVTIDPMYESALVRIPGGTNPFRRVISRLRDAGWINVQANHGRSLTIRHGPRAYGEPADAVLEPRHPLCT